MPQVIPCSTTESYTTGADVTMISPKPLILFIDAYDSFSNNIISLLETTLSCSVRRIKIDDPVLSSSEDALRDELKNYTAVVCGPGPGTPASISDIGLIQNIWRLGDDDLLPVLGICLGFQSLCLEFGAEIKRLKGPQHGIIRDVLHAGIDGVGEGTIFEGVVEFKATHYQSLCVDTGAGTQSSKWEPTGKCPDLFPLAYVESDLSVPNDSGVKDAQVLVAVRHSSKPFWALQYHPESICTEEGGNKVISNWFKQAEDWNRDHKRKTLAGLPTHGQISVPESLLERAGNARPLSHDHPEVETVCHSRIITFRDHITVPEILEVVQGIGGGQILLESTNAYEVLSSTADVRGRFSITALDLDKSTKYQYTTGNDHVDVVQSDTITKTSLESFGGVWPYHAQHLEKNKIQEGPVDSPFWGGFMGYTTYEMGLESIGVTSRHGSRPRPDLCLAWVSRSLVIDHVKKVIYIQELAAKNSVESEQWMDSITDRLERLMDACESIPTSPAYSLYSQRGRSFTNTPASTPPRSSSSKIGLDRLTLAKFPLTKIDKPSNESYESQVIKCQEFISSGDSYELCLTDQTTITRPKSTSPISSWELYKSLRARQPAPFASYISLGGATLVSSSPERFLTWDENNRCSLRPMKGTVRKTNDVDNLEKAKKLLDIPKEKAENLMIVDLVRHDLHGICGSGNVQVPRLCVVEEYKSVFQMISVVEGQVPPTGNKSKRHTGLDVLAASLPPGSMTGAPKKRSCEILQGIENQHRSLYSGVVGYLDVRGRGDWSVTIRSMFKWDDEDLIEMGDELNGVEVETWHIGAGGAVTTLSTAVGEREEMLTKLNGTLGLFA